ncbi:protein adenylyltransferase SelO [Paenibacillus sp. An7]|uniref:protein adenylyltransferase SelO n=1 Tax=Paenibacillus sp. An7 TaxID=2689577 RepID=UPI0013582893|nr:YdiU family protein [Paenibacillus sp. An7]
MNKKESSDAGWNYDNSYSRLPDLFYTRQEPEPVRSPHLVVFNDELAKTLGLHEQVLNSDQGASVLAGNEIPEGAYPLAQAYAGHQFGYFNMLGDGRAVLIGEQVTPSGERFDIQLKGSGRTPYSRQGDGRASLGPMLREYIISEAMHGLGIPTTRSLAVVKTGELIIRETYLPGAILTRVAASHLRVGTFQYAASWGTKEDLKSLADFALQRHFPDSADAENPYLHLLQEVIRRQALLISKWQLVGFIHGVMNTDNMTISGETIDYGPCAFLDDYDTATVFSSIDREGRYAYGNQPSIAGWNLTRLAEALLPLLHEDTEQGVSLAQDVLAEFPKLYRQHWLAGMRAKLGLYTEEQEDETLIEDLLTMMYKQDADYTNTFRSLTLQKPEEVAMYGSDEFTSWFGQWQARLDTQPETKAEAYELMSRSNPAVIPRNHRVEAALEAAVDQADYSVMEQLLDVLKDPYAYTAEQAEFAALPPQSAVPYRTYCGT